MAQQVTKRDGTKEPFDENKIRQAIEGAGKDAGLAEDKIQAIVARVAPAAIALAAGKAEISTGELKTFILGKLDEVEPQAAAAWRNYDKAKGK